MFFLLFSLIPLAFCLDHPVNVFTVGQNQSFISMASLAQTRYIFASKSVYTLNLAVREEDKDFSTCYLYKGESIEEGTLLMNFTELTEGKVYSFDYSTTLVCDKSTYPEGYLVAVPLSDDLTSSSRWFMRIGLPISMELVSTDSDPAYLTTYCAKSCVEYLQSVYSDTDGTFSIHAGMPGSLLELTSFPVNNSNSSLPQEVRGTTRTYKLVSGTADLEITTWSTITSERNGFFMSANYPEIDLTQNAAMFMTGEEVMIFNFTIVEMAVGEGNFSAKIDYKDYKSYAMFLQTDLPVEYSIREQKGYNLSFELKQGTELAKGGLVRFEIRNAAHENPFLTVVLVLLFRTVY